MLSKALKSIIFISVLGQIYGVCAAPLNAVVENALMRHPEVLAAVHERMSRNEELAQALSGFGPTLDLAAGVGRETSDTPATRAADVDNRRLTRHESGVVLRQMLFDGFATASEVERQSARVESAAHRIAALAENTALQTIEAYLGVLRREELLQLAKQNLEAHQQTYDQISLRSDSGVGRRSDLDQVTGRLALAMANVITEQSNLDDARANFQKVTGEMPVDLAYPEDNELQVPASTDELIARALAAHPTLKSAQADVAAAQAQKQAARHSIYPRFDVEAESNWNDNVDGQTGLNGEHSVMLRMRYNLFSGGRDSARQRQTAHLVDQAREIRNHTQRQVIESVQLSWNQFNATTAQLVHLQQHVDSSTRSLDAYVKQFNIGQRSLLDLLDSRNELFEASRAYLNAKYDRLFNYYRVQAGMGDLLGKLGLTRPPEAEVSILQNP